MKRKSQNILALSCIFAALVFSGCGAPEGSKDPLSDQEKKMEEHAGDPKNEPGTSYPGSAADSNTISDTVHLNH